MSGFKFELLEWKCPECGVVLDFPNSLAREITDELGACAGCRMQGTLARKPTTTIAVLDFFARKGGPASDSWKDSVEPELLETFGLSGRSDTELKSLFGIPMKVGG